MSLIKDGTRCEDKEAAQAQVDQAEAALQLAKSALIQNDVRAKDVEVAKAAVKQAEATLNRIGKSREITEAWHASGCRFEVLMGSRKENQLIEEN